ncbi:MAG: hypothetical protein GF388_10350 [Candidatus Aegiribacteria sp.]|nr:hypothetical protein [Candidatus Aegiribacteria sp.]MBD3295425.1 hypothetical protein [Candidatus Fermentibacteria bacterium]
MILLLASLIGVIPAPGWSDPVISIETPAGYYQRKDLVVTDGDHIHQIWNKYQGESRIGYNVVLSDGTVLVPDTLISRNTFSAHPSASYAPDSGFIGFWREGTAKWYSVKDHEGSTLIPATFYSSEGYTSWFRIDSSLDSLGRVHMVWDSGPEVCYSILEPGVGEVWRDTIPDSMQQALVLVDGNRVHIKFNGPDQWADYIQYDLNGNITVPTVSLVEDILGETNFSSMAVDSNGNVYVFVFENPDGQPRRFCLYKIDGDNGDVLIDGMVIYQAEQFISINDPIILAMPSGDQFYLLWRESDPVSTYYKLIKFAIIDTDGNFVEEPYIAYDYTDEDPENITRMAATANAQGDVFVAYSEGDPQLQGYWIRLGWFDHNWLGVEENEGDPESSVAIDLYPSMNPFRESVSVTVDAHPVPGQLAVYDLSGRIVRTLVRGADEAFLWDGCDSEGNELPPGSYIVQGASAGRLGSVSVVKL